MSAKPKLLSFILIAVMLAAALGGLCLATDEAEAASTSYTATSDSRMMFGQHGTYATASSTMFTSKLITEGYGPVQHSATSGYSIHRTLYYFDLTAFSGTISGAMLSTYATGISTERYSDTVEIYASASVSAQAPPVTADDYLLTNLGAQIGTLSFSSFSVNSWNGISLNAAGVTYLNQNVGELVPIYFVFGSDYDQAVPASGVDRWMMVDYVNKLPKLDLTYSSDTPSGTTSIWDGGAADALASSPANWAGDVLPAIGNDIVFDATSVKGCTWDLTSAAYSLTLATGYTGTITQASDMYIGSGGYLQQAGTLTGNPANTIYCAGSFVASGGSRGNNVINLELSGTGIYQCTSNILRLEVSGSYTLASAITTSWTNSNSNLVITGALNTAGFNVYSFYPNNLEITGTVLSGNIVLHPRGGSSTTLGVIDSPGSTARLRLILESNAVASSTLSLGSDLVWGGWNMHLASDHVSNTLTLDLNGHSLTAASVSVGERGILTNTGTTSTVTVSGAFTLSGIDSAVSGPIVMDCYSMTISGGTYTQGNADIYIGAGGYLQQAGTLVGNTAKWIRSQGDISLFSTSGWTDYSIQLHMLGDGASLSAPTIYLKSLRVSANVSSRIISGGSESLIVDEGSTLNIADGFRMTWAEFRSLSYFENNGLIRSEGSGFLYMWLGGLGRMPSIGECETNILIGKTGTAATSDTVATLSHDLNTSGYVQVISYATTYNLTLDLNGHSLTAASVTTGVRGNILWGEGTHRIGSLDTSAGASDFETSHIIMEESGTINLGAGQSMYDLTVEEGVTATLGSDVEVTHYAVLYGSVVRGDYILTLAHIINSYPPLTLHKFDSYLYHINIFPGARLTMLEYPSWLSWNPYTYTLHGKAVQAGTFTVRFMAEQYGQIEYQNYTITVAGLPDGGGWGESPPVTDYGQVMLYIVVAASMGFILLVFAFMRRR